MLKSRKSWVAAALLTMEAQQVIALRLLKLAKGGPAARIESRRMVAEKVSAARRASAMMLAAAAEPDGGADAVVRMLRRRVQANRKRLTSRPR